MWDFCSLLLRILARADPVGFGSKRIIEQSSNHLLSKLTSEPLRY
jgi:hypothetical protein